MSVWLIVCATCWLCAGIAQPRTSVGGDAMAERVYMRLLGRPHRLVWLALAVTAATLLMVVMLPQRSDPDLSAIRRARAACGQDGGETVDGYNNIVVHNPTCYELEPDGTWVKYELADGVAWRAIATSSVLPPGVNGRSSGDRRPPSSPDPDSVHG